MKVEARVLNLQSGDSERFKLAFPDPSIVKGYPQEDTKIKCIDQFGIAPFINDIFVKNF